MATLPASGKSKSDVLAEAGISTSAAQRPDLLAMDRPVRLT
jgi:hypothetical protein